jgi:hypothetical protein
MTNRNRVESDPQSFQAAKSCIFAPTKRILQKLWVLQATEQRIEGNLTFHACKGCSEAKVCSPPEGEMPVVRTKKIQAIRVGKSVWIAICRSEYRYDPRALLDGLSP